MKTTASEIKYNVFFEEDDCSTEIVLDITEATRVVLDEDKGSIVLRIEESSEIKFETIMSINKLRKYGERLIEIADECESFDLR